MAQDYTIRDNDKIPTMISRHQYGTLRYVRDHQPTVAELRDINNLTLGSLGHWHWTRLNGSGEHATLTITPLGIEVLRAYEGADVNRRLHEAEMTERCLRLLRYSRRLGQVRQMPSAPRELTRTA